MSGRLLSWGLAAGMDSGSQGCFLHLGRACACPAEEYAAQARTTTTLKRSMQSQAPLQTGEAVEFLSGAAFLPWAGSLRSLLVQQLRLSGPASAPGSLICLICPAALPKSLCRTTFFCTATLANLPVIACRHNRRHLNSAARLKFTQTKNQSRSTKAAHKLQTAIRRPPPGMGHLVLCVLHTRLLRCRWNFGSSLSAWHTSWSAEVDCHERVDLVC